MEVNSIQEKIQQQKNKHIQEIREIEEEISKALSSLRANLKKQIENTKNTYKQDIQQEQRKTKQQVIMAITLFIMGMIVTILIQQMNTPKIQTIRIDNQEVMVFTREQIKGMNEEGTLIYIKKED